MIPVSVTDTHENPLFPTYFSAQTPQSDNKSHSNRNRHNMTALRVFGAPSIRTAFRPQTFRLAPPTACISANHMSIINNNNNRLRPFSASSAAMAASVSDAIIKDHRELEEYYNEVVNAKDLDHQTRFGNQFTWELARHSVGEELVVYPAFEKYLGPEGKAMAEHDRKEHHKVKELLKEFQNLKPEDGNYVQKLKELWAPLSEHIKEEEERDLPALEKALAAHAGESESMATSFGRTKAFVPSRSHPSAGEHPPFETVMGLLTAPIDHLGDLFRKFPNKTISPNPSTK
ncbi:hemerythrin-like protein [Paramyrothecium foliicola]|nr:hemerythrin-like protein [Paramyrothecium foliicola]